MQKIVWLLWFQGWDKAPPVVQACLRTWRHHNSNWQIRCIDARTIGSVLTRTERIASYWRPMPPEARSDLVRIALLRKFGGVWVDATVYCLKPLDDWLPAAMPAGFFAFDSPGPDRMVASWFLAAEPGNEIIERWYDACHAYWRWRLRRHNYFWFHHLFADIYRAHGHVQQIWGATPKISADLPHYLVPYAKRLAAPPEPEDASVLDGTRTPVLKLTHKVKHTSFADNSRYSALLRTALDLA